MFTQWELGDTNLVFFVLSDKKIPKVSILHWATNYMGKFGVEDHHVREVVLFVREHTERRYTTPVIINPVNLTMLQK